ncbi:MAG: hypothetical protein JXQ71_15200 [Verrucomicrobia bacterium]|nr:hypothetical protein [Verrucomicrobiota bacterium]
MCFEAPPPVLPADGALDLKALPRATVDRSTEPVPVSQLQPLTGYVPAGVTVLAAKKAFLVHLDKSALSHTVIAVSAGVRGTQILLAPPDYIRATRAATGAVPEWRLACLRW